MDTLEQMNLDLAELDQAMCRIIKQKNTKNYLDILPYDMLEEIGKYLGIDERRALGLDPGKIDQNTKNKVGKLWEDRVKPLKGPIMQVAILPTRCDLCIAVRIPGTDGCYSIGCSEPIPSVMYQYRLF